MTESTCPKCSCKEFEILIVNIKDSPPIKSIRCTNCKTILGIVDNLDVLINTINNNIRLDTNEINSFTKKMFDDFIKKLDKKLDANLRELL